MTGDLLRLADWLLAIGCTHVAMERTGDSWKAVRNWVAEPFERLLVNAGHVEAVPGRKTDAEDGEWLADLLRHGLRRPRDELGGNGPGRRRARRAASGRCAGAARRASAAPWHRSALTEAARAAGRSKGARVAAQRHRLAARCGTKHGAVAVGHIILLIVDRLLNEGDVDRDLGDRSVDERDRHAVERRLVVRLEVLDDRVALEPAA